MVTGEAHIPFDLLGAGCWPIGRTPRNARALVVQKPTMGPHSAGNSTLSRQTNPISRFLARK